MPLFNRLANVLNLNTPAIRQGAEGTPCSWASHRVTNAKPSVQKDVAPAAETLVSFWEFRVSWPKKGADLKAIIQPWKT